VFLQLPFDDRVIVPEDEGVVLRLVPGDTEFRIYIVLHAVVVTVQMIRCDIHQDGDVGTEIVHVVQLE